MERRTFPYSIRGRKRNEARTPYRVKDKPIPSKQAIPANTPLLMLFSTLETYARKGGKRGKKHGERDENTPKMKVKGVDDISLQSISLTTIEFYSKGYIYFRL